MGMVGVGVGIGVAEDRVGVDSIDDAGADSHRRAAAYELNLDEIGFETSFSCNAGADGLRSRSDSIASTSSAGMTTGLGDTEAVLGRTPPDPFSGSFEEEHGIVRPRSRTNSFQSVFGLNTTARPCNHFKEINHKGNEVHNDSSNSSITKQFGGGLEIDTKESSMSIPFPGTGINENDAQQLAMLIDAGMVSQRKERYHGIRSAMCESNFYSSAASVTRTKGSSNISYKSDISLDNQHLGDQYENGTSQLQRQFACDNEEANSAMNTDRSHYIGVYSPEARRKRIQRFLEKRKKRVWTKKVKYDVRKNFADSRMRVKGRFVKKEDEELLRELMSIT